MARQGITRISVDMTDEQKEAVDQYIALAAEKASQAAGIEVKIGTREFFHRLLELYGEEIGVPFPKNYPAPGGWRGNPQNQTDR